MATDKMQTSKVDQLEKCMEPVCDGIRSYATTSSRDQFLKAITRAAQDYLDLPDPVQVAQEIRDLEEKLRKGVEVSKELFDNLSSGTLELIEAHGKIPDPADFTDAEEIRDASRDFLGVITRSSRIIAQKSQNRTKRVPIGQVNRGRPPHRREEFLVSRLATAYAAATGLLPTRAWPDDKITDFEVVIGLALNALEVDEDISAKKLLRRHVRNRNNPK
jgi:hypothetical protein